MSPCFGGLFQLSNTCFQDKTLNYHKLKATIVSVVQASLSCPKCDSNMTEALPSVENRVNACLKIRKYVFNGLNSASQGSKSKWAVQRLNWKLAKYQKLCDILSLEVHFTEFCRSFRSWMLSFTEPALDVSIGCSRAGLSWPRHVLKPGISEELHRAFLLG